MSSTVEVKKEVCKACNNRGTYVGQLPPGRSLRVYCFCEKGKERMDKRNKLKVVKE